MKHNYLKNTEINEAKKIFFDALLVSGFSAVEETVPSAQSCGRILSKAVYASICSPHYNASAMDGIAVKAEDTYGAREEEPVILSPDKYTVVDTGDPIPDGTDAVIMVEDVTEDEQGNVKIIHSVAPWQNIRQIGEDICMGDMIAPCKTEITPALCGAFLAGGVTSVQVFKKPLFGIIPTGDEIVPPTDAPGKGEIIEFNSTVFASMLSCWGAQSRVYDIVKDKKELIVSALSTAVEECDAVLILAGSSAGRDDYTSYAVSAVGEVLIHGIAVKPGKPAVLGLSGNTPIVGLPGYPVSAIVIMEEFVKKITDIYYERASTEYETVDAVLSRKLVSSLKYREYVRVTVGKKDGGYFVTPLPRGAGVITSFTKASGILEIPQDSEGIEAGQNVNIRLLKKESEIGKSLIITGSHDPIIDEISDLLRQKGCDFTVTSSHVGSMGAINAVRSGLAHMGAVHLLDPETGIYNESYVKKYFPDGEAVLVKGIGRVQGIMTAKGNPLGIADINDAVKYRYVNRQRGAGTRVLLDFLLKKNGISTADVQGYSNEKFTHTAVAALIASGSADAGLGIYSAARMYDLDFIPVCVEEYDFLVDSKQLDNEYVKAFFDMLRSPEFKARAEQMGGYSFFED